MKNLFYFSHLNVIGGTEQFFAYLVEKYKAKDITIVYKTGDPKQIRRLKKWAPVVKFDGTRLTCEKAFFCYNADIRTFVDAKEYNLILHADYKSMVERGQIPSNAVIFSEPFDHYYGVSQLVCDSWEAITGKEAELVYNPFVQKPPKKIFKLVYCGRLTAEKGADLTKKFIKRMSDRGIDFQLFVYSNVRVFGEKNVTYLDTRLDAGQFLNPDNFDYLIVFSDNEGYCYSLVQALSNGLPCLVTPCPVFKEIGVNKENSIMLDFKGSNVDDVIDKMLARTKSEVKYTPKADMWGKVLAPGRSTYKSHTVAIQALQEYLDVELNETIKTGEIYDVTPERAKKIVGEFGYARYVEET